MLKRNARGLAPSLVSVYKPVKPKNKGIFIW